MSFVSFSLQVFFVDMLLSFITPFQDSARVWVTTPKKIATTYLKTWFFVDLMSILPFEVVAIGNQCGLIIYCMPSCHLILCM